MRQAHVGGRIACVVVVVVVVRRRGDIVIMADSNETIGLHLLEIQER